MNRSKKKKSKVSIPDTTKSISPSITTTDPDIHKKLPTKSPESVSAIRILFGVIAVSFLSVPICYILSYMKQMKNSLNVFLYSAVICISIAPLTYFLLIKHIIYIKKELFFYIFTIFSFTAIADLLLALTISDYSSAFHFYLNEGEVYLKTGHGLFINYWDGTIHFTLYLIMLYYMLNKRIETKFYRFLSLFWCGSIINSLIVLVGGATVGQFGSHIKPSCLLNIPYFVFPLIFMFQQFQKRQNFIQEQNKKKHIPKSFILCSIDMFFILYMIFGIIFAIFRVLHVLKTPLTNNSIYYDYEPYLSNKSGFPLVQLLTYAFYFVPYYCSAIIALLFYQRQPSTFQWLPDWTMVHAGAAAQAQFSYLCSSLHNPPMFLDASWSEIPAEYWFISVGCNLILAIVPQLFAFRICFGNRDRDFY